MADYSLVNESMVQLGEDLHGMGYDGPQEMIEGHGPVGLACKRCDDATKSKLLSEYLKDLHQTFKTRNPDPEGRKADAVAACTRAWNEVRQALSDDPDTQFEQVSAPPAPGMPGAGPATTQVRVTTNAANRGPTMTATQARRPAPAPGRVTSNAATRGPSIPVGFSPPKRRGA